MFSHLSDNYKGIILVTIGFAAFSVSDACGKYLTQYYPLIEYIAINAFFALVILLVLSPKLGGLKKTLKTKKLRIHILRGLCNTIISVLVVGSFSKLSMAEAYTLLFVAPFITTLISIPVFKEQVNWHGWVAIIVGFIGVLVVLRPGFETINPWLFLPLLSTFFIAGMWLLSKYLDDQETLLSLAFYPACINMFILGSFSIPFFVMPNPVHIPIFTLSTSMVIIGIIGITTAFRIAKSSIVSPFHYTQMIWGILIGYIIFGDFPDIWTLLGASIIIGSGIYLIEKERSGF